jgi:hypothetical protein
MRFVCAAILAPKPRQLKPGEALDLHYQIAVQREPWSPESLRDVLNEWPLFHRAFREPIKSP